MTQATTDRTDRMFRAFSDRTRLRILALLRQGECCVGDLVEVLTVEQPSVSRHLAYLRQAGLVRVRKARAWCFYSLAEPTTELHRRLLECLVCCPTDVPEVAGDLCQLARLRQQGGCCPGESRETPCDA